MLEGRTNITPGAWVSSPAGVGQISSIEYEGNHQHVTVYIPLGVALGTQKQTFNARELRNATIDEQYAAERKAGIREYASGGYLGNSPRAGGDIETEYVIGFGRTRREGISNGGDEIRVSDYHRARLIANRHLRERDRDTRYYAPPVDEVELVPYASVKPIVNTIEVVYDPKIFGRFLHALHDGLAKAFGVPAHKPLEARVLGDWQDRMNREVYWLTEGRIENLDGDANHLVSHTRKRELMRRSLKKILGVGANVFHRERYERNNDTGEVTKVRLGDAECPQWVREFEREHTKTEGEILTDIMQKAGVPPNTRMSILAYVAACQARANGRHPSCPGTPEEFLYREMADRYGPKNLIAADVGGVMIHGPDMRREDFLKIVNTFAPVFGFKPETVYGYSPRHRTWLEPTFTGPQESWVIPKT